MPTTTTRMNVHENYIYHAHIENIKITLTKLETFGLRIKGYDYLIRVKFDS